MTKINRPIRLIDYDTYENVGRRQIGEMTAYRLIRPRTILYLGLIAIIGTIMLYSLTIRPNLALSVLHVRQPMFVTLANGSIRNAYTLRISNKWGVARKFNVEVSGLDGASLQSTGLESEPNGSLAVDIGPDTTREIAVNVTAPHIAPQASSAPIVIKVVDQMTGETASKVDNFFSS